MGNEDERPAYEFARVETERADTTTAQGATKRGPSPMEEALAEAFRAVQRLEAMEESFQERLAPILAPDLPLDLLSEVKPDRPGPASLVKAIEEIAERANAVEHRFSALRERLAV